MIQFIEYQDKLDESNYEQFSKIIEKFKIEKYKIFTRTPCFELDLKCEITSKKFYDEIEGMIILSNPQYPQDIFMKRSAIEMLNKVKEKFTNFPLNYEHLYFPQLKLVKTRSLLAGSPMSSNEMEFSDIYYGELGIIQILQTLFQPLQKFEFRGFCTSEFVFMENLMMDIRGTNQ